MGVTTARERADRLRAWRYYAGLHRGNGRAVAVALAALLGQTAALLAIPAVVSAMFDGLGPVASTAAGPAATPQPPLLSVLGYGAAVVALYVLNALLNTAGRRRLFDVTTDVTEKLRRDIVAKVFSLSVVAWEEADRALLETSLVQDAEPQRPEMKVPTTIIDAVQTDHFSGERLADEHVTPGPLHGAVLVIAVRQAGQLDSLLADLDVGVQGPGHYRR